MSLLHVSSSFSPSASSRRDDCPTTTLSFNNLPVEALKHVTTFLNSQDCVSMTSVNHKMRFEVAPLVENLIVSQVSQMTTPLLATRFANIRIIDFECHGGCIHEQPGFVHHLIPFLQTFGHHHLERVIFSDAMKTLIGIVLQVPQVVGGAFEPEDWDRRAFPLNTVIHQLCHAFSTEILPRTLRIERLFCPWPHDGPDGVHCHLCRDVVRSFPFTHLVGTTAAGEPVLKFQHLMTEQRPIERWMVEILVGRLEEIPLEEARPTGMILYRHLQSVTEEDW